MLNWVSMVNHTLFMLPDRMSMQAGINKIMNGLKSVSMILSLQFLSSANMNVPNLIAKYSQKMHAEAVFSYFFNMGDWIIVEFLQQYPETRFVVLVWFFFRSFVFLSCFLPDHCTRHKLKAIYG